MANPGFCALPFVQYSIYNGGRYRLCCMAKEPETMVDPRNTWYCRNLEP